MIIAGVLSAVVYSRIFEPATIIIVAGTGDSQLRRADFETVQRLKSARQYEAQPDGSVCVKLEEKHFILIRKSFAPLRRLRFRVHLASIYKKFGPDRQFPFREIVAGEFEHSMDNSLKGSLPLRVGLNTGVCFAPGVSIALDLPEFPSQIMYGGSRPKRSTDLLEQLKTSPAFILSKPEELQRYRESLSGERSETEISLFPERDSQLTISQSAAALAEVNEYMLQQNNRLDETLDVLMEDPRFSELARRRKINSMEQAKLENPGLYALFKGFLDEELDSSSSADNGRLMERFDRAKFNTKYGFFLNCWDGKGMATVTIK